MHISSHFAPAFREALSVGRMGARRHGHIVIPVVFALGLGACAEIQLAAYTAKELVAKVEEPSPKGDYKIGDPYRINGKWYTPAEDRTYDETGVASWYGATFHGRSTANGSIYDMNALTAAHKTLPMPSLVRVTNLENGRSLTLTVNDRGPFVGGRIIDVSRRASQLLGFYGDGTARVRVQSVRGADSAPLIQLAAAESDAVTEEPLQVVDFKDIMPEPATPAAVEDGDSDTSPAPVPVSTEAAAVEAEDAADREPLDVLDLTRDFIKPAEPAESEPVTSEPLPALATDAGPAKPAAMVAPDEVIAREPPPVIETAAKAPVVAAPPEPDVAAVASEVVAPGPPPASAEKVAMYVQAGAFTNVGNARRLSASLARLGPAHMTRAVVGGRAFYRVRIGPMATLEETNAMLDRVIAAGHPGALRIVD